jgi:glutathione S-transferase
MPAKFELYSAPLCPFAHRTRLTLAEKRLAASVIDIDLRNRPAPFAALTPTGEVPVLSVNGQHLWNSAAIDEYLEEVAPGPALLPPTPVLRAQARAWVAFADQRLYAHTKQMLMSRDAGTGAIAMAAVRDDLRIMTRHAAANAGPYWMGEDLTLVDLAFVPWFEQSVVLEKLLGFDWSDGTGALRRWYAGVQWRPSVKAQSRPAAFYLQESGRLLQQRAA